MNERTYTICDCCDRPRPVHDVYYFSPTADADAPDLTLCARCVEDFERENNVALNKDVLGQGDFDALWVWVQENSGSEEEQ
jgi:hypothetical protein